MFWGLILEQFKHRPIQLSKVLHISAATLDLNTVKDDKEIITVYVKSDSSKDVIICHLSKQNPQVGLDLMITSRTSITFYTAGSTGTVHLSGYLVNEDIDDSDKTEVQLEELGYLLNADTDDFDEKMIQPKKTVEKVAKPTNVNVIDKSKTPINFSKNSIDKPKPDNLAVLSALAQKQAAKKQQNLIQKKRDDTNLSTSQKRRTEVDKTVSNKKPKFGIEEKSINEEDENDETDESDDFSEMDSDEEEEEIETDEEENESETEQTPFHTSLSAGKLNKNQQHTPKAINKKLVNKTPQSKNVEKTTNGVSLSSANKQETNLPEGLTKKTPNKLQAATPKKTINKPHQDTPKPPVAQSKMSMPIKKTVLKGGVTVEDLKLGNGPEAKFGKKVGVYFTARLLNSDKPFDQLLGGNPFQFELGKREIVKGWEIGIAGMKVGSKRRITIPPEMGYGIKGSPPVIPPNSTLVFEVELKQIQ